MFGFFRNYWEKQKEFGKWLDEKFAPLRKPDYICLVPGCVELNQWIYLEDGRELPVPKFEMSPFFSKGNWRTAVRAALDVLKHPVKWMKEDAENNRNRYAIVMGACGRHRRENCFWTSQFLKKFVG
jgi:hypothetical protein